LRNLSLGAKKTQISLKKLKQSEPVKRENTVLGLEEVVEGDGNKKRSTK
jgi:hypothetical protein